MVGLLECGEVPPFFKLTHLSLLYEYLIYKVQMFVFKSFWDQGTWRVHCHCHIYCRAFTKQDVAVFELVISAAVRAAA